MKKDSVRGWKDVFTFTLQQTLKSKAYIGTLIFMIVIAIVSMPLMNLILSNTVEEEIEKSSIEKVYLSNMTVYQSLDIAAELPENYQHIEFTAAKEDMETLETRLLEEEENSVVLTLKEDDQYCYIQFLCSPKREASNYELQMLGQYVQNAYTKAKVQLLGLSTEELQFFETSVVASASVVDTESAVVLEDTSITEGEYWFIYGMMFVVLMVCVMAASQVASSIVQEKSTRVIEYLLTSVRPLAIIVGKVFAMLVSVMIQLVALVLAAFISMKLGEVISGEGNNVIAQFMTPEMLASLNFVNIVLGLIVAGAGMVFFSILAGLCGATASRMEDANESLSLLTILSLVGFYIGFGAAGTLMASGDNAFVTFALIFPLSSSFLLPAALLVGKAELWITLAAIVVLLLSIVLMFGFVAKVYEGLILHNGNRLKMKEVFAMAKDSKKQKENKEENA